jgi:hypothetical protein
LLALLLTLLALALALLPLPLALLTLLLALLALLALLPLPLPLLLLLLALTLELAQRELEVRPRALERGIRAQRVLVRLDGLAQLLLAHLDVAAVVVRARPQRRILGLHRAAELIVRLLVERPALALGRRLGLAQGRGALVVRQPGAVDASVARALVRAECVVVAPLGVGAIAGVDIRVGAPQRLPAPERQDDQGEQQRSQRAHAASLPRAVAPCHHSPLTDCPRGSAPGGGSRGTPRSTGA